MMMCGMTVGLRRVTISCSDRHREAILTNKSNTHTNSNCKTYGVKYTENSKNITLKNNISIYSLRLLVVYRSVCRNNFISETSTTKRTEFLFMEY